jgi:hypothetical protein
VDREHSVDREHGVDREHSVAREHRVHSHPPRKKKRPPVGEAPDRRTSSNYFASARCCSRPC